MKITMKRKISLILTLVLMLSTIFSVNVSAANYPSLSSSAYCEFSAAKQINVWKNTNCTKRHIHGMICVIKMPQ